mmetsp:Transcript_4950/g.17364  ORF Transcript_4950/g.17364 Transcript_4950/m.17364 type:complete len:210 (-) Transcript_4950:297-926(-)
MSSIFSSLRAAFLSASVLNPQSTRYRFSLPRSAASSPLPLCLALIPSSVLYLSSTKCHDSTCLCSAISVHSVVDFGMPDTVLEMILSSGKSIPAISFKIRTTNRACFVVTMYTRTSRLSKAFCRELATEGYRLFFLIQESSSSASHLSLVLPKAVTSSSLSTLHSTMSSGMISPQPSRISFTLAFLSSSALDKSMFSYPVSTMGRTALV